jgi:hypothetical protein
MAVKGDGEDSDDEFATLGDGYGRLAWFCD